MLKYDGYSIVLQEVPDEISLVFTITGCPHRCDGCHSEYLWNDTGSPLEQDIYHIITDHRDEISCVCFMGGDQERMELIEIIDGIHILFPELKIALYTGDDDPPKILYDIVDYIKIGHFDKNLGGLNSKDTNQHMYRIIQNKEDITHIFQKRHEVL